MIAKSSKLRCAFFTTFPVPILVPPGNRLEPLKADRAGQHSIRVNDHYRVCFRWRGEDADDVEIVDYH